MFPNDDREAYHRIPMLVVPAPDLGAAFLQVSGFPQPESRVPPKLDLGVTSIVVCSIAAGHCTDRRRIGTRMLTCSEVSETRASPTWSHEPCSTRMASVVCPAPSPSTSTQPP